MALILDIDGDGELDGLTDGRLVLLYLLEQLNESVIPGSIDPENATRTTLAEIEAYLDSIRDLLDIDGNGEVDALSDGRLNVAEQLEVLEAVLQTALGEGATRTTSGQIGGYLDSLENELPVAADDSATIVQGTNGTIAVLENDSDPDGNPLTIIGVSDPVEGNTVSINDNGDLVYTAAADFEGPDSLLYTISDGRGGTASATVNVTGITNEPPVAANDEAIVAQGADAEISVLANDTDPDGNLLTIITVADPENGTVDIDGDRIIYSPNDEFTGTESFTYSISDGAATDTATVTVTVQPAEQPLTGTDGADVLIGDNNLTSMGVEQIIGGAGDDVLVGGRGADRLTGGEGADRFEYLSLADSGADPNATLEAGDSIQDFDLTVDTIALLFDVAPDTPVTAADVDIKLGFINFGQASIGLSTPNMEPDFLPGQFSIILRNLDPTTTAEDILGAIVFA